jgi:asparagine N-glycosylation enzyme membrane subunit Stt3
MSEEISFNLSVVSNLYNQTKKFLSQKKVLHSIYFFLLSAIILISSKMRLQNLSLLKDSTTGEFIPTALDPFYFLRIAKTIIEQGSLPASDSMR